MKRHFGLWSLVLLVLTSGAAAETLKLRVGVIPVLGASPLFVADKEGWLKAKGIELSIATFETGVNIVQAAAGGMIDVYVAGVAPLAVGRAKGVDLRIVAATAVDENVLVTGPKLAPFLARAPPAGAFKAFHAAMGRPAKIATQPPGSVPAANLQYWLREVTHTNPRDIEIVAVGIDAAPMALLSNAVEAATLREPALTIVRAQNHGMVLAAQGEDLFPGQPGTIVAVSSALIAAHPAAVQALVDAIARAVDELRTDPDRAAPLVVAGLSKGFVDSATIRAALSSDATRFIADPNAIATSTRRLLAYQVTLGVLDKAPPMEGMFDLRFFAARSGH